MPAESTKRNGDNKFVKFALLIGFVLLGAGLFVRYIAYSDFSFTVLSSYHRKDIFTKYKATEILSGESVAGRFKADDNNLGIVAVRFNTFQRKNDDIITFRIKESGQKNWLMEQSYRTTLEHEELYNFGLTPVADSKNKLYIFEIASTRGKAGDAVAISTQEPVAATKYKYSKQMLFEDKSLIPVFLWKKIVNEFTYSHLFYFLIIFFIPAIWYLIRLLRVKYTMEGLRVMILALIAMSIFLVDKLPGEVFIILGGALYAAVEKKHKTKSLLLMGTAVLAISAIMYQLTKHDMAIRAAAWVFMLFAAALLSTLADMRTAARKK